MENVSLIGLPFYSLAKYRGMGLAVKALRELGIAEVVKRQGSAFRDLGDVPLSEIEADSGPANLRNFPQYLRDTDTVLRASSQVGSDDFVFCLGGECTFIAGTLAGFKTKFKGKPGILWMDAHGDFNTPETTISGFIGGMCLAFACGRGPKLSSDIESARPLLSEENVVHLANRALDPLEEKAMQSSPLRLYSASDAHRTGIGKVAREAAEYLADRSDWIICHLDVDSIDNGIISAVNFPEKGSGLTLEEIKTVVHELRRTGKLKVFDLAAYNPNLDLKQGSGDKLLKLTSEILSMRGN
jgi:arginase